MEQCTYSSFFQMLTHNTRAVQVDKNPEKPVARQLGNTDAEHKLAID